MKIALFYHSLLSDWNHGNAHFLRGYASELQRRGHEVSVYEPRDGWSLTNLRREHGEEPVDRVRRRFPGLRSYVYDASQISFEKELEEMDLVIVHEWTSPETVRRIGRARARLGTFRLLFHDTHHRSVTRPEEMESYDLEHYDGVLAFGETVRRIYLERGWARRVWTWHEAADTQLFRPIAAREEGDLVWIGNWGDGERTEELRTYLLNPARELGLTGRVFGVRYPEEAVHSLERTKLQYSGWLPNYEVPEMFSRFRFTVHIPRRPYVEALPGIPTIRPFEAMACGIPLICSPWEDAEHLFHPGEDYLVARDGTEMKCRMRALVEDADFARDLGERGRRTVLERHTCAHRVEELLEICRELGVSLTDPAPSTNHTRLTNGKETAMELKGEER